MGPSLRVVALFLLAIHPVDAADQVGVATTYVDNAVACPKERYAGAELQAAHRSLPCGSLARVQNVRNGRSVVVRIVDRGPYVPGAIIDLTPAAARAIGSEGRATVVVTPLVSPGKPQDARFGPWRLWDYRAGAFGEP